MQGFARANFTRHQVIGRTQDSVGAFETGLASVIAAAPHTKGAYTELIASLAVDAYGVNVSIGGVAVSGQVRNTLYDLAVGDVGSESIIINNIGGCGAVSDGRNYYFSGLSLPTGTRLSVRGSSSSSGQTTSFRVFADTALRTDRNEASYVTYGCFPDSTTGTPVLPGVGVFGTWTQVGTITREHKMWSAALDQLADASLNAEQYTLQLGYGPGVNSVVGFVNGFLFATGGAETVEGPWPPCGFAKVNSGQLLWVRALGANAESRGVIVYGN